MEGGPVKFRKSTTRVIPANPGSVSGAGPGIPKLEILLLHQFPHLFLIGQSGIDPGGIRNILMAIEDESP